VTETAESVRLCHYQDGWSDLKMKSDFFFSLFFLFVEEIKRIFAWQFAKHHNYLVVESSTVAFFSLIIDRHIKNFTAVAYLWQHKKNYLVAALILTSHAS
jgi:hypothetical protein